MLFKPQADKQLDGVFALLQGWNAEADGFRTAADAARAESAPSAALVEAAEGMHGALMELLADIDEALDRLPAGHRDFATLLKAQTIAVNLLESVGNSLDVLGRFAAAPATRPGTIEHRSQSALEAAE